MIIKIKLINKTYIFKYYIGLIFLYKYFNLEKIKKYFKKVLTIENINDIVINVLKKRIQEL